MQLVHERVFRFGYMNNESLALDPQTNDTPERCEPEVLKLLSTRPLRQETI